jgi:putative ABC transport system permease protein
MGRSFAGDVRQAVRSLAGQPGFALVVMLTLGLGIGANTAIFSAVHGLLLRDPPFADPDRLVRITSVRGDEAGGGLSVPELDDLLMLPVIESAAMYTDLGMYNASGFGTPEELQATITTHNLFQVLGVAPLVGSTFPPEFDRTRNFGLVISHGLWVRKFGRDPNIVGRTMTLDGAPGYTIYGVMPLDFNFPSHSDLFRSSGISANPDDYRRREARERFVLARIRPGVTIEQARSAIGILADRLAREYPATNGGLRFSVTPLRDMYSAQVRPYVLLLFGAVVLVLVVACANVANLTLSRAIARDRDLAVRAALGAPRWRIVQAFVVESLVLAAGGAVLGVALAWGGVRILAGLVPIQLPPWMTVAIDARAGAFLGAAALLTAIVTGLVPALHTTSRPSHEALKEGARGSSGGVRHNRLRNALIVSEVALALVLLVGASLMLRSLWKLTRVDPGFDTHNALTFRVELGWAAYGRLEKTVPFHEQVMTRLSAVPGVEAVTFDNNLPMSGTPREPAAVRTAGESLDDEQRNPYVNWHEVGPDYFEVMGIDIVTGRGFDDRDVPGAFPAAIVSQPLAERLWPGRDPVGQQLQYQELPDLWLTVVGVAGPVLHHELDGNAGFDVYRPWRQATVGGPYYVIRTSGDPMSIAREATAIIGETDPNQSFLDVQTFETRVASRIWQRRLAGVLFGSFAGLALLLVAVGLYGILSYSVSQQTREIGVRLALGATERLILGQVLGRGLRLVIIGIAIGGVLALSLARLIAGLLYGVAPLDPTTLVLVPALLLAVALLACYLPARRAMRVDPLVALRSE